MYNNCNTKKNNKNMFIYSIGTRPNTNFTLKRQSSNVILNKHLNVPCICKQKKN